MRKLILVSSMLCLTSLTATAQTSSNSSSGEITASSSVTPAGVQKVNLKEAIGQEKFQENNEITDTKLKAESGSLSRYSLSFNLSYYGPTIGDLEAPDQPNPDGSVGTYETSLGGSLSGRYRFSPRTSVNAGTGVKAIHPFHGMERFDMNNPFINFNLSDKIGEVQMKNSFGFSAITVPNYTKIGETASLNYDLGTVYNLGASRVAIGLDLSLSYFFYNRGYQSKDGKAARYNISVYPNLKYNATDKLNINTSVNLSSWNPRSRDEQSVLLNRTISQRLGVGYAFTRDIYFAPYINFFPSNLSPDGTTLNVSTIFSVL